MQRLTDLREILRYVPHYRDKVFVIAIDGAVVEDENFGNLLLDIALVRSLRVGVVLVHGAAFQIERLAGETGRVPSNCDRLGVTDEATLDLAMMAANRVTHDILEGLAVHDLRAAAGNAVIAHPAGILQRVDYLFTGKVERIDTGFLQALLERDIIPVIPPLGTDGEGQTYRLNSDAVAVEAALGLKAVKLIYLAPDAGVRCGGELVRQLTVEAAEALLQEPGLDLSPGNRSKLTHAVLAARGGVPRVHIIDGREPEGLLAEVFSPEGIGTLVHANEYQSVRPARKQDARAIRALIRGGVENEELLPRTRADIERLIGDFYVFEVDRTPVACMAVHDHQADHMTELACLFVDSRYENQGIGAKLMQFAETVARQRGATELFCLSTQAFNYFVQKGGYRLGTPDDLPPARRERYERNGRKSQVLVKQLDGG